MSKSKAKTKPKFGRPKFMPGQKLGDNLVYVGIIQDYHLLCWENDEPDIIRWDYANKFLADAVPNREELSLMFANKILIGGFRNGDYWSSTELYNVTAWSQRFSDGSQFGNCKSEGFRVRCVRRVKFK